MKKAKPRDFSITKYNKVVTWARKRYLKPGMDIYYGHGCYKQIEYTAASRYLDC